MENTKHTQGTWIENFNNIPQPVINITQAQPLGSKLIARVNGNPAACTINNCDEGHDPSEEAQANAKLIAAAPELLYQLKTAVEHIKNIQEKYNPEHPFAIGGYEEAIKKATES